MNKIKAILLIPGGFVGCMNVVLAQIPPRSTAERLASLGAILLFNLLFLAVLFLLWTRPAPRRYLGFSGRTWAVLEGISLAAGMTIALLN